VNALATMRENDRLIAGFSKHSHRAAASPVKQVSRGLSNSPGFQNLGFQGAGRLPSLIPAASAPLLQANERLIVQWENEQLIQDVAVKLLANTAPPDNKNTRHAAATLLRTVQLQGVALWIEGKVNERLAHLQTELVATVRADDPTDDSPAQLAKLFNDAEQRIRGAFAQVQGQVEHWLRQVAKAVGDRSRAELKAHHNRVVITGGMDKAAQAPVLGLTLGEHFKSQADGLLLRFKSAIRTGLAAGDTLDKLVNRVTGDERSVEAVNAAPMGHEFYGNQWTDVGGGVSELTGDRGKFVDSADKDVQSWPEGDAKEQAQNALEDIREDKSGHVLVVRGENGRIEGLAKTSPSPDGNSLNLNFMASRERGQGAGRKMMLSVLEKAGGQKKALTLHATLDSAPFYRKFNPTSENGAQFYWSPKFTRRYSGVSGANAEFVSTALQVAVRIVDAAEGSFSKLIESAVHAVAQAVEEGVFDSMPDADKSTMGWQWVGVLDDRICERCEFYDGSLYDSEYEPVGDSPELQEAPPLHFNCRCKLVAVDLEAEPLPKETKLDGWLKTIDERSPAATKAVFGQGPTEAFRRGDLTGADLLKSVRPYSPDEFAEIESVMNR
jgi:hypothetical protein